MANPIPAERLTERTMIVVDGVLEYSRLTSLIQGEELARRAQSSKSMYPTEVPHTTVSVTHARIRPFSGDPNNLTLEEQYIQNSFYVSGKDSHEPGRNSMYSLDNKSTQLPLIYAPVDANNPAAGYDQVLDPQGELASGLNVTLILEVYKPANYAKRGIALRAVNVNEEIRYFGGGGLDKDRLAAMGIVINGTPRAISGEVDPNAGATENTTYESGYAAPQPNIGGTPAQSQGQQNQQFAPQAPSAQQTQPQYQDQGQQFQNPGQQYGQPQQFTPQQGQQFQNPGAQQFQAPAQNQAPAPAPQGQSAFDQGGQQSNPNDPWDVSGQMPQAPNQGVNYNA